MKTKEITLCGKQVTLAYCFATEIAYKEIADEEMLDFIRYAIDALQQGRDPDAKRSLSAIYACIIAYAEATAEEGKSAIYPFTIKELMNNVSPSEYITAMLAVIDIRNQFYHTPKGDEATASEASASDNEEPEKNA